MTSVSMRAACSSAAASRNSRPRRAARPVATRMAVGVASPSAHGQAMTSTAMACTSPSPASPNHAQAAAVAMARPTTTGTKTPEMRSANRWIGGLAACAARTRRTMPASTVSRPVAVARASSSAPTLSVPAKTASPCLRATGSDSPVSMDSSRWAAEMCSSLSTNSTPSTGTDSPVGTRNVSPGSSVAASTSCQTPSRSAQARCGARSSSARRSRLARSRACSSRRLPTRTRAMISTADSK